MSPVEDPVTLGEVSRNVSALRVEMKEFQGQVNGRLDRVMDRVVGSDIYAADKATLEYKLNDMTKDLSELRTAVEKKQEQRSSDKRMVLTAIIVPTVLVILNMIFTYFIFLQGG